MRQQIGGHEGTVGMPRHSDTLAITKAAPDALLDNGFSRHDELIDETVIDRFGVRPDDRHGSIFHQGITLREEESRARPGNA